MKTLLVIISHSPTATAFKQSLDAMQFDHDDDLLMAFDIYNTSGPAKFIEEIEKKINDHSAQSVLILTDLIGSTPFNISKQICNNASKQTSLITGVNLPMLLKSINYQDLPADDLSAKALLGATESIITN